MNFIHSSANNVFTADRRTELDRDSQVAARNATNLQLWRVRRAWMDHLVGGIVTLRDPRSLEQRLAGLRLQIKAFDMRNWFVFDRPQVQP